MTEIARVSDYEGLVLGLRMRRNELGLTHLAVDEIAGLQTGYTGKIECGTKRLGAMSLTAILGALGVELVLMRAAGKHRNSRAVSEAYTNRRKKLAIDGGLSRGRALSPERKIMIAREAARARWRRERERKQEGRLVGAPSLSGGGD